MIPKLKANSNFIKEARKELGVSQRGLAKLLNISQSSIGRYELEGIIPILLGAKLLSLFKGKYTFNDLYRDFKC